MNSIFKHTCGDVEEHKRKCKPRFHTGDKVAYQGRKWKVTFVHTIESALTICYMYDLHGKKGRFCCIFDSGHITLIKNKNNSK